MSRAESQSERTRSASWWERHAVKLILLLLLVGVVLAVGVPLERWYRQRQAIELVRKELKGDVQYDYQLRGGDYNPKAVPPGPAWVRSLLGDDVFANVEGVNLSDRLIGPATDLDVLLQFPRLRRLSVAA
jgi:hypothetical protein